jgi:HK97 family phage portal protein
MGLRGAFVRSIGHIPDPQPTTGPRLSFFANLFNSVGVAPQGVSGTSGLALYYDVMSIPAFWRGSNLLSDLLAQVDWDAYTIHGRDQEELVSPRPSLLEQPAPPDTRYTTFKSQFLDYLINGNAISVIATRDAAGKPTSFWPVPAAWCGVRRVGPGASSMLPVGTVEYSIAGQSYAASDVLHVKGACAPGSLRGFGILEAHFAGAIATAHEQQRYVRNMSRPGVPPGYLRITGDDAKDPEELEEAKRDWMRQRDEGGVAALNANVEFQAIAWNPDQMQLVEARQLSLNEIANLLGLPSGFVNSTNSGGTSLTYATVDSEALGLLKWTMGGHFVNWEQTLSLAMPHGTKVRANLDHFLRGDTQSRYTAYSLGISSGWLRRSEVRSMERLPVVPGIDDMPPTDAVQLKLNKEAPVDQPAILQPRDHPVPVVPALASRVPELDAAGGQRAVSRLPLTEHGLNLWRWLTGPEGMAEYLPKPHPWTALRDFLLAHDVPAHEVEGEATNIMLATPAGRAAFAAHHQGGHHG